MPVVLAVLVALAVVAIARSTGVASSSSAATGTGGSSPSQSSPSSSPAPASSGRQVGTATPYVAPQRIPVPGLFDAWFDTSGVYVALGESWWDPSNWRVPGLVPLGSPGDRPLIPAALVGSPFLASQNLPPGSDADANVLGGTGVLASRGITGSIVPANTLLGGSAAGNGSVWLGPQTIKLPDQDRWDAWQQFRASRR